MESLEYINSQLIAEYGLEHQAGSMPRFRVVFSDDEIEKRLVTHTKDGFQLLNPVVEERPKYKHYIQAKYILERLIPVVGETDLVTKVSYEPAWVFVAIDGITALPPRFDACKVIIESLYSQMDKANTFTRYKDETITPEYRAKQLDDMYSELFGNETTTADALRYKEGVVNPADKEHFVEQNEKV